MIECAKCKARYPTERVFCGKCREPLGFRCTVCAFINLLDDLFCGLCNAELKPLTRDLTNKSSGRRAVLPKTPFEEVSEDVQADIAYAHAEEGVSQKDIDDIFKAGHGPQEDGTS